MLAYGQCAPSLPFAGLRAKFGTRNQAMERLKKSGFCRDLWYGSRNQRLTALPALSIGDAQCGCTGGSQCFSPDPVIFLIVMHPFSPRKRSGLCVPRNHTNAESHRQPALCFCASRPANSGTGSMGFPPGPEGNSINTTNQHTRKGHRL